MRYFAYGSNMLAARLRRDGRVPSARALGTAVLHDYRVIWIKRSVDGSGKCGIVSSTDCDGVVWGRLFDVDPRELAALDQAEGAGHGYERRTVFAHVDGTSVEAVTYVAIEMAEGLRPYDWYKRLVVAGAMESGLPEAYIEELSTVPSVRDTDVARRDAARRLLAVGAI